MRLRLVSLLASSLLLTSHYAIAQEPAGEATAAAPAAPAAAGGDAEDEVTCEREAITGSRVKKRTVCMSERQRKQERELTSQALGGLRSNQTSNGN